MSGRRNPARFPVDDRRIYDAYIAGRRSAALAAGVRIGLFDLIDGEAPEAADLEQRLGVAARPLASLLAALLAMGVLERDGPRLALAPDAAAYLVRGRPGSLCGLIDMEVDHFLSPAALLEALREGRATVYGGADPWQAHAADPALARAFTAAMHSISERPAAGLAEVVDLEGRARLLDVGGGSGALSIALARTFEHLRCTVWDLEVVCAAAREYAADAGLAERVCAEPGDMFAEPYPRGFDVVLLSQILHDWPPERGAELLVKAHDALPPGGLLLVHEKLMGDDERGGPLANALVGLDMAVWTEGQQYDEASLRDMLADAGFERIERRATAGYWSVVSGVRNG